MLRKKSILISILGVATLALAQGAFAQTWPTHDAVVPLPSFTIPIETVAAKRTADFCLEWNLSYAIYS